MLRPPVVTRKQAQGFSIVMAMRDTPREREFAKKSIPSAIALNPSEMIVGIDGDPGADELTDYIQSLAGDFNGLRVVSIPRSGEWRFSLANVIWHCYKACNNDAVLVFDVDTVLRPAVMKGSTLVGHKNVAVVSFTKRFFSRTVGDYVRYISYRIHVRRSTNVFAGTYWLWRPYYFDAVDRDGLSRIVNGIDTYMVYAIGEDGRYKILTLKDIGVNCLDYENEYYPWRQFADGVYWGANKPRAVIASILHAGFILCDSMAYNKWLTWKGYRWAWQNYGSDACQEARQAADVNDWCMRGGSRYFADMSWGRQGTGYA